MQSSVEFCNILNQVKDELTEIPCQPDMWLDDGRMYPPQADNRRNSARFPGLRRYRSKGHNTWIDLNGAIQISLIGGETIFEKPGIDGGGIR